MSQAEVLICRLHDRSLFEPFSRLCCFLNFGISTFMKAQWQKLNQLLKATFYPCLVLRSAPWIKPAGLRGRGCDLVCRNPLLRKSTRHFGHFGPGQQLNRVTEEPLYTCFCSSPNTLAFKKSNIVSSVWYLVKVGVNSSSLYLSGWTQQGGHWPSWLTLSLTLDRFAVCVNPSKHCFWT